MSDTSKIETLIQQRQVRNAKASIVKWLRANNSLAHQLQAIDWYRRLSLYSDGLRLIMRLNPFESSSSKEVKLAAADFLSYLGAIPYALQLAKDIEPQTPSEIEIVGGIHFSANNYAEALHFFNRRISIAENKQDYSVRLSRLSHADCVARMGNPEKAIELAKELLSQSTEHLFRSICKQAIGEYFAYLKKYKESLSWLIEAKKSFPGKENSYDHALLFRWLGFTYCRLGKKTIGRIYLKKSSKIIKNFSMGDYVWLENLKLERELKILPTKSIARLELFPGIPEGFTNNKKNKKLSLLSRDNKIQIYFGSNEYVIDSKYFLGIPMEIKLIGFLKIVGTWGIGLETLKTALWPNEGHSYLQLENRLRQILKIVKRKYHIRYKLHDKRIYLSKRSIQAIGIVVSTDAMPIQLKKLKLFTRSDFQKAYNLKKAQAAKWLKLLASSNLIASSGTGPATKYYLIS